MRLTRLVPERPAYAADSRFDIALNDETDRYWQPEGITKTFLDRLHGCINTATGRNSPASAPRSCSVSSTT